MADSSPPDTAATPDEPAPAAEPSPDVAIATPSTATPSAQPPPAPPPPSVSPAAPTITAPPADYSAAGVPSLDFVRDKIEGRYATAQGATELAESVIPEVKDAQEQAAAREKAAQEKLAEIRRSLRGGGQS